MKKVFIGLMMTFVAASANAGEPVIGGIPTISAIEVQFGDFGNGGSHQPQAEALELVSKALKSYKIGKFVLGGIQHHGEIQFCVEAVQGRFVNGDLTELKNQIESLQGPGFGLSVQVVPGCE